jgi:2-polyprenyl-3-methyl-5-hydroxy-6-metoxy-1,4-benzoquinol methylase
MQSNYYTNSRDEVFSKLIKLEKGRILEIGCGSGIMLTKFSMKWPEYEHVGVDIANMAMPNSGFKFICSDIYSLESKDIGQFDIIVLLDVLEHFGDSEKLLNHMKTFSKPNSIFVFSIPNIRFIVGLYYILVKKDFPELDSGIFDRTHIKFYTKNKILRMMNTENFKVDRIVGINSIFTVQPTKLKKILAFFLMPFIAIFGVDSLYQQYFLIVRKN